MATCRQDSDTSFANDNLTHFYAAAMAIESLGHQLEHVSVLNLDLRGSGFDISEFSNLLRTNRSLSTIQQIRFQFTCLSPWDDPIKSNEAFFRSSLAMALNHLNALKSLSLNFDVGESRSHRLIHSLAKSLRRPSLAEFHLLRSVCLLRSISHLLSTHRATLRQVVIWGVQHYGDLDEDSVRRFLTNLQTMDLDRLMVKHLKHSGSQVGFPRLFHSGCPNDAYQGESVSFHGHDEVQRGIEKWLECVVMDYSCERDLSSLESDNDEPEDYSCNWNDESEDDVEDGESCASDEDE